MFPCSGDTRAPSRALEMAEEQQARAFLLPDGANEPRNMIRPPFRSLSTRLASINVSGGSSCTALDDAKRIIRMESRHPKQHSSGVEPSSAAAEPEHVGVSVEQPVSPPRDREQL